MIAAKGPRHVARNTFQIRESHALCGMRPLAACAALLLAASAPAAWALPARVRATKSIDAADDTGHKDGAHAGHGIFGVLRRHLQATQMSDLENSLRKVETRKLEHVHSVASKQTPSKLERRRPTRRRRSQTRRHVR